MEERERTREKRVSVFFGKKNSKRKKKRLSKKNFHKKSDVARRRALARLPRQPFDAEVVDALAAAGQGGRGRDRRGLARHERGDFIHFIFWVFFFLRSFVRSSRGRVERKKKNSTSLFFSFFLLVSRSPTSARETSAVLRSPQTTPTRGCDPKRFRPTPTSSASSTASSGPFRKIQIQKIRRTRVRSRTPSSRLPTSSTQPEGSATSPRRRCRSRRATQRREHWSLMPTTSTAIPWRGPLQRA